MSNLEKTVVTASMANLEENVFSMETPVKVSLPKLLWIYEMQIIAINKEMEERGSDLTFEYCMDCQDRVTKLRNELIKAIKES